MKKIVGKAKDGREMKAIQVLIPFNESKDSINYALVIVSNILITFFGFIIFDEIILPLLQNMYTMRVIEHVGERVFEPGFPFWLHSNANGFFTAKRCSKKYLCRIPKIVALSLNLPTVEYKGNSIRHSSATMLAESDCNPINLSKYVLLIIITYIFLLILAFFCSFLGHKSLKTSTEYVHNTWKQRVNIVSVLIRNYV